MVTTAPSPYQKYLKTTIETASQPQLLLMLFDAAVKKLHIARKAIEESNIEVSHNELIKVQRIFSELMVALDFEIGGELAHQLFSIYDFVYRQLVQANIRRDVKLIDETLPIVEVLREGWTKAVAKYQEEELSAGHVARTQRIGQKDMASNDSGSSALKAHQDTSSVNPARQLESQRFPTLSPAQDAESRQRPYPTPPPIPEEPAPRRLNLRG